VAGLELEKMGSLFGVFVGLKFAAGEGAHVMDAEDLPKASVR
jgi:hypothetical protein